MAGLGRPGKSDRSHGDQGAGPRQIEIGLDNNRMVHVLDGLSEGEQVLLAPPLTASAAPRDPRTADREEASEADDTTEEDDDAQNDAQSAGGFDMSKLKDMTPEQRRKMFENLSDEQKQKIRQMMQQRGRSSGPPSSP